MSKRTKKQLSFNKEINTLLYALGDVPKPATETVKTLDDILISYLSDLSVEAYRAALYSNRTKVKLDDFKFTLRRDPVKLARLNELHALDKAHQQLMKEINYQPEKQVLEFEDNDLEPDNDNDQEADAYDEEEPSKESKPAENENAATPGASTNSEAMHPTAAAAATPNEPVKKKRKYTRRKPKTDKAKQDDKSGSLVETPTPSNKTNA
ncbi:hypothetical protein ACO0RG_002975 [Hanseniaspora osmophila]|uniref:Transcription initiation factor TFIID subunit 13 n=1 Tax=Hanseniaspora osmophila TaxID=56408 RepID=A0A1E5RYT4_9ASCO|nr:Transcription initiation factor TFIID subunit 13 [Hanseniaspora osmophila]